jgi:hypothetical protein
MSEQNGFRTPSFRPIAMGLAFAFVTMSNAGCGSEPASEPLASMAGDSKPGQPELIGGEPARAEQFRATVGINDECTAAKVGARLFLTAAHCVALGRPVHGMPVPENFPPNGGVRDEYLPGKRLSIYWGLDASDGRKGDFVIARTSIHPSWWDCPACGNAIVDGLAADIAVIELGEDTPKIPEASVELANIVTGTSVVKVGWGCEERTNVDAGDLHLGRFKLASASTIPVSEIRRFDGRITDDQVAFVGASYLVTAGHAKDAKAASLCLGDSGGPLYLNDGSKPRIVGVNSDYTFKPPVDDSDKGGVSWTDWHTRTSLSSGSGIGEWLKSLKVNTVVSE